MLPCHNKQRNKMSHVLHYFNPTGELAIANGLRSYRPPAALQSFENDLSCLPIIYSKPGEYIYSAAPKQQAAELWEKAGMMPAGFIGKNSGAQAKSFILEAWCNSPNIASIFCSEKGCIESPVWINEQSLLFRRETAAGLWDLLISNGFASISDKPVYCASMPELYAAIAKLRQAAIKLNYTSSGRGVFLCGNTAQADLSYLRNRIKNGLIVEKLRSRIADFSLQFQMNTSGASFFGAAGMTVTSSGRYQGSSSCINSSILCPSTGTSLLQLAGLLQNFYSRYLPGSPYSACSHIGIDILAYMQGNSLKLQPCVEINPRKTMGYAALRAKRFLCSGSEAQLFIHSPAEGPAAFAAKMFASLPLSFSAGKIEAGFLPVSDYLSARRFIAYIIASAEE
jgi:hypothetical protein